MPQHVSLVLDCILRSTKGN